MIKFPQKTGSVFTKRNARKGMTLVEVMVSMAILAILAILAVTSLFYPRYLVVNSGLEQSAIHAATAEIERHLHNHLAPGDPGIFNTDGWVLDDVSITTTATNVITEKVYTDDAKYLEIKTTIKYRDRKTVELVTYRSLEVPSSKR